KIDVLESMGSEFYAYFVVETGAVSSRELDELAADAGGADLPSTQGGVQITARLAAESKVRQGAESELWFDSTQLQLFDAESGSSLLARDGATQPAPAPAAAPPPAASGTQTST